MQNGVVSVPPRSAPAGQRDLHGRRSCAAIAAPATREPVHERRGRSATFDKPVDNIGEKTIPDYVGYAAKHIYDVNIPGCAKPGRVFVGQRQDPFAVNLGVVFDMVDAPVSVITDPAN